MRSYTNKVVKVKQSSFVTLQQAKEQLNVEEDFLEDDEHILFLIDSATSAAEDYTGTDIALTSNTLEFIRFNGESIQINESPYKGIVSITSTSDGNDTIIGSDDYEVQINITGFVILFNDSVSADALTVVFQTGYDIDESPKAIVSAILVKLNDLYDIERTSFTVGANFRNNTTFERLLNAHVINRW